MNEFDFDIDKAFVSPLWKCTMRFKGGGGSKYKPPAQPQLSEIGREAEEKLYGAVERGLAGGGFFPFAGKSYEKLKESYGEAYQTARGACPEASKQISNQFPNITKVLGGGTHREKKWQGI